MKPFFKKIIRSGTPSREDSPHRNTAGESDLRLTPDKDDDLPRKGQLGLIEIHRPALHGSSEAEFFNVDIVAIHGLGGDIRHTWTHENGVFWLRDLLPHSMPGARIFSYGYPSDKFFNRSDAGIRSFADNLLYDLSLMPSVDGRSRPVIYVCHSLGGIVLKEAMNKACDQFPDVWMRSKGVIFLGTPHRGSRTATRAEAFGQVFNLAWHVCGGRLFRLGASTTLLRELSQNSAELADIAGSFKKRAEKLLIVTFYEQDMVSGTGTVIVDRSSAEIGLIHEICRPLRADHRALCRFESKDSRNYKKLLHELRNMAESILKEFNDAVSSVGTVRSPDEAEKTCFALLNTVDVAAYECDKASLRVEGTLQWIFSNKQFTTWLSERKPKLLWVSGYPGCGKTVLSSYIINFLSGNMSSRTIVCRFFCSGNTDQKQQDPRALLQSIIYQIVYRRRKLLRLVKKASDRQGLQLFDRFNALWDLFVDIINHEKAGSINVIVDAIDEFEDEAQRMVIDRISQLLKSDDAAATIKFFMTSRPQTPAINALENNSLEYIRLDLEEMQNVISEDVDLVIRWRLGEIINTIKCDPDIGRRLERILIEKAERSFLWVSLVLPLLKDRRQLSLSDLQRIPHELPNDLKTSYERLLESIPSADRGVAGKLLRIIVASARPLNVGEINIFLANGQASSEADYTVFSLESIQVILGPLIRVLDLRVYLVHQTLKEYLIELSNHGTSPLAPVFGVRLQRQSLTLALACVRYLARDDFDRDLYIPGSIAEDTHLNESVLALSDQFPSDDPPLFPLDLQDDPIFKEDSAIERCDFLAAHHKLYDYAAMHWAQLFAQSNDEASLEQHDSAIVLCDPQHHHLGNWFCYFWTRNDIHEAYPKVLDALVIACFFGHSSTVRRIFDTSSPSQSSFGAALYWAAHRGHISCVDILLRQHGFDIGSSCLYEHSPLAVAAQYGHLQCVEALMACGRFDVNELGKYHRTPISFAAGSGHEHVVAALLSNRDINVNLPDSKGYSPLFWAVAANSAGTTRKLLADRRVNPNHLDRKQRSALSWAAADGYVEPVRELVKTSTTDLNNRDSKGRTPLIYATEHGNSDIVELLIRTRGIDLSCQDKDGRNAISWAAGKPRYRILHSLLSHDRRDADVEDKDGWTPLAWALDPPGYPDNISMLLQSGLVDVNHKDRDGLSTLSLAASYGYVKITQLLVRFNGVDLNSRNKRGATPLHYAASSGNHGVIQMLLDTNGIEVDPKDNDGRTPLSWAASAGRLEVVGLLSRTQGVDIGSIDKDGRTPLWYARHYSRHDIVPALESIS